jgi:hypothetical protein
MAIMVAVRVTHVSCVMMAVYSAMMVAKVVVGTYMAGIMMACAGAAVAIMVAT